MTELRSSFSLHQLQPKVKGVHSSQTGSSEVTLLLKVTLGSRSPTGEVGTDKEPALTARGLFHHQPLFPILLVVKASQRANMHLQLP